MGCDAEYMQHKCEAEISKLKRERDELAAQVEVMREALMAYQKAGFGNSTDFRLQGDAYDASVRALSITPSDALREIQARTLEHASDHEHLYCVRGYLRAMASAKRKGE